MKTILIVDDDPVALELIDFLLRKSNYKTLLASKAQEALKILEKETPDLIILDFLMPEMKGTELCARLKSNHSTANTPVIFLTAMAQEREIEEGYRAGAAGYIFKPYDVRKVVSQIEEILSNKK